VVLKQVPDAVSQADYTDQDAGQQQQQESAVDTTERLSGLLR